jgi:large subunit ribosomal protein L5
MATRLKEKYQTEVRKKLQDEFDIKNPMAIPKVEKVVLNMGVGEAISNIKVLDNAVEELATITGQKPVITKAKKSIASFKLREGQSIGTRVTLRGEKMYEFLDRLINIALPRVRDFRGVPTKSFDGRGNYTLGLHDQLIFPEIDYSRVDKTKGMNVTIVTTAANDDQARVLLRHAAAAFTRMTRASFMRYSRGL